MNVYMAINAVQTELAGLGIGKDRKNVQQGYNFRGIDDMYNAIAPLLAKHKLLILPEYSERVVTERRSAKDTALFYVNVAGKFTLVSAEDGSAHMVGPFYGEAMDTGDKATNKAQSAAFKYMAMQTFCIPTQGDNDADATTHEVKHESPSLSLTTEPHTARQVAVDAFEELPAAQQTRIRDLAVQIIDLHDNKEPMVPYVEAQKLDTEDKLALWSQLDSKVRSAFKREQAATPKKQFSPIELASQP